MARAALALAAVARSARGLARPSVGRSRPATSALGAAALTSFPLSLPEAPLEVKYGGKADEYSGDLIVLPFWEVDGGADVVSAATSAHAWDLLLGGRVSELARDNAFTGKKGSAAAMTVSGKYNAVRKVALFGLGTRGDEPEAYAALGAFASKVRAGSART